jgi:hypothetical protein
MTGRAISGARDADEAGQHTTQNGAQAASPSTPASPTSSALPPTKTAAWREPGQRLVRRRTAHRRDGRDPGRPYRWQQRGDHGDAETYGER